MRRNSCPEETCARHLFYALYLPDLFMRRLIAGRPWSLFCPDECPGLQDAHGAEFDALYEHYEAEGRARAVVQPNEIWEAALASASETGVPYIVYKDAVNRACNQSALGTIRSSNLCCEITQFSGPDEIAVCNLASLALPAAVRAGTAAALDPATALDPTTGLLDRRDARVDHALLERMAYAATINLNRVLDASRAPLEKARRSNERHRAVGLGVQGLADVFCLLGLDFDSVEARAVNRALFETVYFGALSASADLAERDGPYETFWDSPAARGQLQFDMLAEPWIERPEESAPGRRRAGQPAWAPGADSRHDWAALKRRIQLTGLRNSLVVALMPTASTSQILGYNECFEPFTKNVYQRKTQAGLYTLVNRYLVQDLEALGRWVPGETNLQLLAAKGSLTGVPDLPAALLRRYRTADELPMKAVIDLAADRQAFVCQSQSMNLWMPKPDFTRLTKMHLYAWRAGLKTGQYYLHTEPHAAAQQFAVVPQQQQQQQQQCSADEEGVCASCSA
jgi:ribonucleoside-diphosphate reductase alpha subunit